MSVPLQYKKIGELSQQNTNLKFLLSYQNNLNQQNIKTETEEKLWERFSVNNRNLMKQNLETSKTWNIRMYLIQIVIVLLNVKRKSKSVSGIYTKHV